VEEFDKRIKNLLRTHFEENNEARIKKMSDTFNVIMVVDNLYNNNKLSLPTKGKESTYKNLKEKFTLTLKLLKRNMEDYDKVIKEVEKHPKLARIK